MRPLARMVKLFGTSATNLADKLEPSAVSGATVEIESELYAMALDVIGRGLHLSSSQLNLSRVCHKKTPYTP